MQQEPDEMTPEQLTEESGWKEVEDGLYVAVSSMRLSEEERSFIEHESKQLESQFEEALANTLVVYLDEYDKVKVGDLVEEIEAIEALAEDVTKETESVDRSENFLLDQREQE